MNISRENTEDLAAIVKVQLTEEDYAEQVKKSLNDLRKKANIPGFRQGKVPLGMINKMYGSSVKAEEVNKILSNALNDYIKNEDLKILGNPIPSENHEKFDFSNQKEFTFSFDIGLSPEIKLELNKKIKVPYFRIDVADKMIDDYVKDMQERFGEHNHPESIQEKSKVLADFTQLDLDGDPLIGGIKAESASFNMEDLKLKSVAEEILGKKVGDVLQFDPLKAFEDNDKVASILKVSKVMIEDLKANFKMEIKEITEVNPAELNEELFEKAYPSLEIKTEEELRNKFKEDAEKQFEVESDKLFMSKSVDKVIETADISLPDAFLKRWIIEQNEGKMTAEQIEVQYDSYSYSMKWQLIQNKIITENNIEVSQNEVRDHVRKYISGQYFGGMDQNDAFHSQLDGIVENVLKNEEEEEKIYNHLYDEKILKLFKETLTLNEESISLDDFIKKASESPQS
jgi:trigger factor